MKKKHPRIHQMTIAQFEQLFPNEDACKAYLPLTAGLKVCAARAVDMNTFMRLKAANITGNAITVLNKVIASPYWLALSLKIPTNRCASGFALCT